MKLFVDANDAVYAFEDDGSQDEFITPDLAPITQEEADALRGIHAPTQQDRINAITSALQQEMDRQARLKNYDGILSACSYAAQPEGAPFQAEGAAYLAWRSSVWQQAYATQAQVLAGTATMLTPAEAVAAMPALVLPS